MGWKDLPGWGAFIDDVYNDYLATRAKSGDVVVETGLLFGRSIAALARGAMDRNLQIQIHGVDPFLDNGHWLPLNHPWRKLAEDLGGPYVAFNALMFKNAAEELEYVRVHRMTSLEGRKLFADKSCALVLLDDDHSYEGCAASIAAWRTAVRDDGLLAGDDFSRVDFPGVVRAVEEAFGKDGFTVRGTSWIAGRHSTISAAETAAAGDRPLVGPPKSPPAADALPRAVVVEPPFKVNVLPNLGLDTAWVLVESVGGNHWLGKIVAQKDDVHEVTLSPAFELPPSKLFFPAPQDGSPDLGVGTLTLTGIWTAVGTHRRTRTVVWASIERLTDLPQAQQDTWLASILEVVRCNP